MTLADFHIGLEFTCGPGRWRCTDVGSRVVVAIQTDIVPDASWLSGPPYAVLETVFDEYDIEECAACDSLSI